MEYPKVVVFDLDYTLWPCWCDTHISPPLRSKSTDVVVDKYGYELSFYKDVGDIFQDLQANGVLIVSASRTCAPAVAKKLLKLLHLNGEPAINHLDHMEWGTHSKKKHIARALEQFEEDIKFEDVILFDDEVRNKDVESIGCLFAHISNEKVGLNKSIYERALGEWRKKNKKRTKKSN